MNDLHRIIILGVPLAALLDTYNLIELSELAVLVLGAVWVLTFVLGLRESMARVDRQQIESEAFAGECND